MLILQTTGLYEPAGDDKISSGALSYIATRVQLRAYDLVIRELRASGITQAQLAKRLGKAPEVISRMLSRPGNWEMKTFSELLFAISGAVPTFTLSYPVRNPAASLGSEHQEVRQGQEVDSVSPSEAAMPLSNSNE